MKLKALARFAGAYGESFHRIEALAEVDGRMKVIDMKIDAVCDAVLVGKQSPVDLYRSSIAVDYGPKKH
jgi:type III restriction enzyme